MLYNYTKFRVELETNPKRVDVLLLLRLVILHDSHQLLFQGKGLPEALILVAWQVYPDKIIISESGEALWPAGHAVSQRLVDRNLACYEPREDRFVLNR